MRHTHAIIMDSSLRPLVGAIKERQGQHMPHLSAAEESSLAVIRQALEQQIESLGSDSWLAGVWAEWATITRRVAAADGPLSPLLASYSD